METNLLLGIFFVVVIVIFAGCMFFIPELLGISKSEEKQAEDTSDRTEKGSP